MALFSRILRFFTGGGTSRTPGYQFPEPTSGRLTTRSVTAESALQLSAVFACVRLISETIAGLPLRFYSVNGDGTRSPIKDHPLYRLLSNKPNRYQTRVEFFETIASQLALHGNAYAKISRAKIDRNERQIVELLPLMSTQVQVVLLDNGDITYQYHDGRNVAIFSADSIWHVKLMSNGIIGMSPLDYARNSIGIAISAEDRVSRMANTGFKPSGILMIDKTLRPEQREQIRQAFSSLVDSGDDALKILEAGMKYQQISMNPRDVQLLETRRFQLEDIARFFGVPSVLINDTSASTVWGSGIYQIVQGFYKLGLRPYLERIESSIEQHLLLPYERGQIEVEFDFSALLRGDEHTRMQTYKEAVLNGLATVNECRRREGLPPVDGGDVAMMQAQMRPLARLNTD